MAPAKVMTFPRTVLISGASRGIGRAIAERLLADGHRLSLGVRNPDVLRGSELDPQNLALDSRRLLLHPYEASDPAAAQAWVEASVAHFGGFDSLIHCAGVFSRVPLLFNAEQEPEIEQLWQVNVMGPWRVVVLVSMSGKRSKGRLAGYTASKFALMGLAQTMRNEGWQQGIRVSAICPSWVNTDMAAAVTTIPREEMTQPEDIANLTARLLELPNRCVPFELAVNCSLEA